MSDFWAKIPGSTRPARRTKPLGPKPIPPGTPPPFIGSVAIYLDKFYVYAHVVGTEIIYVGKGRGCRGFDTGRLARGPAYRNALGRSGAIEMRILSWHDTNAEALKAEGAVIREHLPRGNKAARCDRTRAANEKAKRAAVDTAFKDKYKDMHLFN